MSDLVLLTSLWLIPADRHAGRPGHPQAERVGDPMDVAGLHHRDVRRLAGGAGELRERRREPEAAGGARREQRPERRRVPSDDRRSTEAEVGPVRPGRAPAVDPLVQHPVLPGPRRDQPQPGRAHRAGQRAGVPGLVEHREADQGLLRALPAADGQHDGGVPLARPVPVLRVLRGDAAADVLPDRHLGRPEARVRGDQVPALHALRLGLHPGRGPDPLLLAGRRGGRPASRRTRSTSCSSRRSPATTGYYGRDIQFWVFLLFFIGFSSSCRRSRSTPGCPTRTSRRRRRSA